MALAAPMTRLEERREELRDKFAELQWDLGGAAYEMAARDYFRLDVLASLAADLQVVDAELAEIERMARLESAGAAGSCAGCGSLYARGAMYCWRCGRNLDESKGTVVGPSAAGQIVMDKGASRPAPQAPQAAPARPAAQAPPITQTPRPAAPEPQPRPVQPEPTVPGNGHKAAASNGHTPPPGPAHPLAGPEPTPQPKPEILDPEPVPEMRA